ncbi:MAG: MFS transporter [Patescibacteria group bacterium]
MKSVVNRFIKIMIFADFLVLSAFGFIGPIMAVFITAELTDGSLKVAGIASMIFLVTKSLLQIPIAKYIDKNRGEWDDFYTMIAGYFIITAIPFLYLFISDARQLYLAQFIYGIGGALAYPGWVSIFARHIDKGKTGFEWSLYSTTVSIGMGLAAFAGGYLADKFGFYVVFILVGIFSFLGTLGLLFIRKEILLSHHLPKVARIEKQQIKMGKKTNRRSF